MNDGTAFQKRRKLLDMLDEGLVMVHLDPRPDEVIVPGWLKSEPVLRLNLAYGFRLPALDIGAEGVYAVLSFNKQNFGCNIPWSAVFAMTAPDRAHEGRIWPESLPPELAIRMRLPEEDDDEEPERAPPEPALAEAALVDEKPPAPPLFKVHEGGASRDGAPTPATPTGERKRPHLKLVKG